MQPSRYDAMMFSQLEQITGGQMIRLYKDQPVTHLLTDSRKAFAAAGVTFFAIRGAHHDGHAFIAGLYRLGIRQFVIEDFAFAGAAPEANVLRVESSLRALQEVAASHRSQFSLPVIGITGSNGKTIIKEWLYQLMSPDFRVVKNPASYNSQLGVPLSVWQLQGHHNLGIFEAGISTRGEMELLEPVIKPTLGIFANIGSAHDEGFKNTEEKIAEKLKLFRNCEKLIYCCDHALIHQTITARGMRSLCWGSSDDAAVRILPTNGGDYRVTSESYDFIIRPPFSDAASLENCFHCVCVLLHFGLAPDEIARRITSLRAIPMRLEVKEGINHCQIVDDTYNNDVAGLQVSLEFLSHQNLKRKKRVILSDIVQSGLSEKELVEKISSLLSANGISDFVGIGPVLSAFQDAFPAGSHFYHTTDEFLTGFDFNVLGHEVILVKGARMFAFEKIVNRLQLKVHGTVMEIDLGALVHNLNHFKSLLNPGTRVMAMVKAFAYGSGSSEIANVLQYHKADYLGVAYADEGVELRSNHITLPVMVMNSSEESFDVLLQYDLEPEIYNPSLLRKLTAFLRGRPCKIHLKIDTGMRRLGFEADAIDPVTELLLSHPNVVVASVFSHLAGADEPVHDDFSRQQAERFQALADRISQRLGYRPLYHILNSSGVLRFPRYQFDMVRLGIGLYGVNPIGGDEGTLKPVATLKTVISQIKHIPAGESVGYGRRGRAERPLTTATIAIGYADGFSRAFGDGVGRVLVNGRLAPVVGNVCMDMTMVDITDIPAAEGDEVVVFGRGLPIEEVAKRAGTIPYEILVRTSERVKRVFVAESI